MSNFKVIHDISEINLPKNWVNAANFKSQNRIVDENGRPVSADYQGRRYRIISKKERAFSTFERIRRVALGSLAVVFSAGLALFSKSVRQLFTKQKESALFAVPVNQQGKALLKEPEHIASLKGNSVGQTSSQQGSSVTLQQEKISPRESDDVISPQRGFSSNSSSEFDRLCNEPYKFYQEIEKAIIDETCSRFNPSFPFLKLCPCEKMNSNLRIKLENDSIELLKQTHPSKETINVVSVGAGGLYQELVYLAKLAKVGYKNIRLIAIDPKPIFIGALDGACKDLIPAKITIDDQYTSLANYIQKATQDKTLRPDLLLLIDLTDDKFKVNSQFLSDYSFDQLYHHNLLKNGTVVSHSVLEKNNTIDPSGKVVKVDFTPKAFSGIFTPNAKGLSSINATGV